MSIYRIKMNGKTYEMEVEFIEEGKPQKVQPAPVIPKPVVKESPVVEETIEVNPNAITAPMPGSIIQVMVKPGDEVAENDVVLILEAMKMENEVCAPKAGKIKSIFAVEGQTVSADAPLFEMEE